MPALENAKILIMSTHGFKQSELEFPLRKLRETGATVHVASFDREAVRGWDGGPVSAARQSDPRPSRSNRGSCQCPESVREAASTQKASREGS